MQKYEKGHLTPFKIHKRDDLDPVLALFDFELKKNDISKLKKEN